MAFALVGGVLMVTIGGVMLGIGIYLSGTLFGSLDTTNLSTEAQNAYKEAQANTFTAFKILGIALIVAGFAVIIGTLIGMVARK
jgi:hypothetical protein